MRYKYEPNSMDPKETYLQRISIRNKILKTLHLAVFAIYLDSMKACYFSLNPQQCLAIIKINDIGQFAIKASNLIKWPANYAPLKQNGSNFFIHKY